MKQIWERPPLIICLTFLLIGLGINCSQDQSGQSESIQSEVVPERSIKRVGMVVGIDPAHVEEYKRIHADGSPGVRDLLNKYHMHNFSIFLTEIEGKWYEFGYYEYTGDDFEADMAALAKEPRNIEWLNVCDPMQIPLHGEKGWREMERIYFNQ
jgi:L-rhamnose mutarotase